MRAQRTVNEALSMHVGLAENEVVGLKGKIVGMESEIVGLKSKIAGLNRKVVGLEGDVTEARELSQEALERASRLQVSGYPLMPLGLS
jgi:predicted  nucleic acid-binding Zn-ribbon protein